MFAFHRAALPIDRTPPAMPAPSRRERLAIVATGSRLCGIGAYTAALCRQMEDSSDITVFKLNQYLLRNPHRAVRQQADRHIREICRGIRGFDAVNLQLEYGTLGRSGLDIYRRFCWLSEAAPRLSVTFHTLLMPPAFPAAALAKLLLRCKIGEAARLISEHRRGSLLSLGVARQLRLLQCSKPVSAIVHNRQDLCDAVHLYGIARVFDHPLAFLGAGEIAAVRADASRRRFPMLDRLPDDAVLVGVFGFINEYKGLETVIRALSYLPDHYHLLIFGGIHPQEITPRQHRHPYISSLFDQAYMDTTLSRQLGPAGQGGPTLVVESEETLRALTGAHPRDLSARIHFMGAPDEADFLCGMATCDAVVFPYIEVGQSASGPISQALELGCRIIASRTRTFLEFAEYHPDRIEFFDIGNHLELAERLRARRQFAAPSGLPEYNVASNKATYLLANSSAGIAPADAGRPGRSARARDGWPVRSPAMTRKSGLSG
jgi:glycosyltransferase involved in cell wall biosynthesis